MPAAIFSAKSSCAIQTTFACSANAASCHSPKPKALAPFVEPFDQLNALRRFQRWELLRIGAADFFGLLDLPKVTLQLSRLADALVWQCLTMAAWRRARQRRLHRHRPGQTGRRRTELQLRH
ncbi:MAG: hypothetical protein IPO15_18805 [Anaerolineae bacterium]|nr:hypothetical protein [Anaerolineae bacterium]